jgi:manganese efflux pump family protein
VNLIEIILIALVLSFDAFAVAVGVGMSGRASSRRDALRLSFHFGLFQFFMPIAGWYAGYRIKPLIEDYDHWAAFGLLGAIGLHMIISSLSGKKENLDSGNPTKGLKLVLLSLATSIDALAVGLSIAMLRIRILYPSVLIGIITSIVTLLGIRTGNRLNSNYSKYIEAIGGVILIIIGANILAEHLMSPQN